MMKPLPLAPVLFACISLLTTRQALAQVNWPPVDPSHLALKASRIDPDADAEVLLWKVHVDKDLDTVNYTIHLRIKIFNERGRDAHTTIDLPFDKDSKVRDIAGRTIRPDGNVIDLKPDSIIEREILRARKVKVKALSFTLPGVEPGAIIEYRYRAELKEAWYIRLDFQRDIPVQFVEYSLKIKPVVGLKTASLTMQIPSIAFKDAGKGIISASLTDVPAFRIEPHMPPDDSVRKWVLIYPELTASTMAEPQAHAIKVDDEVRRVAASLINPGMNDNEKLAKLYKYCRENIRNVSDPAAEIARSDLATLKANKSASETIRRGIGTGAEINTLFGALAIAAGYEARITSLADRGRILPETTSSNRYFDTAFNLAIRVGNDWRFFDPGSSHVAFGMLRWQEEGVKARIPDGLSEDRVETPMSPPDKSVVARDARLRLSSDGDISGQITYQLTGHLAADTRLSYASVPNEARIEQLLKSLKERFPGSEVTNLKLENFDNTEKPLSYTFDLKLARYAQRTARRIIFQPAIFQLWTKARFCNDRAPESYLFRASVG